MLFLSRKKIEIIKLSTGHDLVAPGVLPFEIGNALSELLKKGKLDTNDVINVWDAVQAIPVELRQIDIRESLKIASRFNIYAYDAYFIECALSLRCSLITLDRQMKMVAQKKENAMHLTISSKYQVVIPKAVNVKLIPKQE